MIRWTTSVLIPVQLGLLLVASGSLAADTNSPAQMSACESAFSATSREIAQIKSRTAYPEVPTVEQVHLPKAIPYDIPTHLTVSAGLEDPVLERARDLHVFEDFKYISDLKSKDLTDSELQRFQAQGHALVEKSEKTGEEAEKAYLKFLIEATYEPGGHLEKVPELARPEWQVATGDPKIDAAFGYTERTWEDLVRKTVPVKGGSLLPSPYPVTVPAGRFQESYYWDTYFGAQGLLATGRLELAQMQVENLLTNVQRYGFVPNGGRDYYLSRSQPPVLSSFVRDVYEASLKKASSQERARLKKWLAERAYPLLERDYKNFWMNPDTRYDAKTGLNRHWDSMNSPRPERYGSDNELALGKTYRDVRAAAESGMDFTDAFQGEATQIAGVMLNSLLFKTERDLAWMAEQLGRNKDAALYRVAAAKRKTSMRRYLWNATSRRFENYNLRTGLRVNATSGDLFSTLFARVASAKQAQGVRDQLRILEGPGGIRASNLSHSTHQWDGNNGWAPYQFFAIQGLRKYGYSRDAKRIAKKWVHANAKIHDKTGVLYERINVDTALQPETDATKYPPQPGFLWTNGVFDWALIDVLGHRIKPASH